MWIGGQDLNGAGGQIRTEADFLRASEHLARSIAASRQALMGGFVVDQASSNPLSSHPGTMVAGGYPYNLQPRGNASAFSLPLTAPQGVLYQDASSNPGATTLGGSSHGTGALASPGSGKVHPASGLAPSVGGGGGGGGG